MFRSYLYVSLSIAWGSGIIIGLITSNSTPSELKNLLATNLVGIEKEIENLISQRDIVKIFWVNEDLNSTYQSWHIPSALLDRNVEILLDVTNIPVYSQYLSLQAIHLNLLHIVIGRPINSLAGEITSPNTLYVESSYIVQASALYDLIETYNWQNIGLIHDQDINNLQMANFFKSLVSYPVSIKDELIIDENDYNNYFTLAERLQTTTRDSGARVMVVMTDSVHAAELLRAADLSVMGGSGYSWIFCSKAMTYVGQIAKNSYTDVQDITYGVLKSGGIGIMAEDEIKLIEEPLTNFISIITVITSGYIDLGTSNGTLLYEYIMSNPYISSLEYQLKFDSTGIKIGTYSLYNLNNFAANQVGHWDYNQRKYTVNSNIIWPGFSKTVPNDMYPIITLGLLYPATDASDGLLGLAQSIKNGFDLALSVINNSTGLLEDYIMEGVYVDTLSSASLASVNLKSLTVLNIIGYVGPYGFDLTEAYATSSSLSTDPKPIISYQASDSVLTDATIYPSFLRTVQPDGLQAVAIAMFLNVQSWKSIGVIYTNDNAGIGIYSSFVSNVATLDIDIINTRNSISVDTNPDGSLAKSSINDINAALDALITQQVKIIVFLGNYIVSAELARAGYSKELYGPDYCWVGSMWLNQHVLDYIRKYYPGEEADIMQVLNGAFGLTYRPAIGADGQEFAKRYLSEYGSNYTAYSLLAYDTAYLFGVTVDGMINRGEDYTSGRDLTNALRGADFTGASGEVKFSEGTNDRSAYGYTIINVQNGEFVSVIEYDPTNPNIFTDYNNVTIVWGGGSSSPPSDTWGKYYDCPFAEKMSKISVQGVLIVILIGAGLFILTLVLSIFSYRKWRQIDIVMITAPVVRNWKDTLVQAQIFIEFFQFLAIAPSFDSLKIVIQSASNIFMLDIIKIAQTNQSDYFVVLPIACGLCYSWFILVILIMTNAENWLKKVSICQRLFSLLNTLYLPFFGNTMFLPSLALLLDVFVCDHQAQGRSYVWRDCYMECWGDNHKPYIAMSAVAIAIYEPVAVFSRPLWQQAKSGLNIKIKPFFLLLKTCVQILLIAVGKSLQGISPVAHGVVYSILILVFTITTYKIRPFNYNRCNLWEFSSLLAVTYMSILATISLSADSSSLGWFITLMIGWGIIGGGTVWFQKKFMPNFLVPPDDTRSRRRVYDILAMNNNNIDDSHDKSKGDFQDLDVSGRINAHNLNINSPNNEEQDGSSSSSSEKEPGPN
jgi:ABC-type branched-subunit amino acid transport system substrate-binding protein